MRGHRQPFLKWKVVSTVCGISGWVAFDQDLRTQTSTLDAMTETMACRGPDDHGSWTSARALLGHRRLAVIDLPGGRQPMTAQTADGPVTLVYSGETYNFTELRTELTARGHPFTTRSDTEVVLRGYLEWGTGLADRLVGMYAFAIWDGRQDRLILVRDRLGVKPLHYRPTGDGLIFGSEVKALLAHPDTPRRVGIDGLRQLAIHVRTPGHAVWEDIYEVPPGCLVVQSADGLEVARYWRLETRPHTDDLPTTIQRVRDLLEDVVAQQLVADVPRCVLLSGGLDSSTLTAIAANQLRADGKSIRSFAVDYVGHAEHFDPQLLQLSQDAPYAHEVAAKAGTDHTDIVLDPAILADPDVRGRVISARDVPTGLGDTETSLYQLFTAIREYSTVALSGEAADEVFGGYTQFFSEAARTTDMFAWIVHFARQLADEQAIYLPEYRAALDLDTFLRDDYASATAGIDRLDGESDADYRMRQINHLHITRFVRGLLDRKDRLSMAVGLEVRVPFCDHRLVEYVYNTPWSLKTHNGREKDLLRAAAADLLPPSVLERVKSGYPATPHPDYVTALRQQAAELVRRRDHRVFDLVRREWVRSAADTATELLPHASRRCLERVLDLAQWIDIYNPRLSFD